MLVLTSDKLQQRAGTRVSIETNGGSGSNDAETPVQLYAPANTLMVP
jgi:hypothetical protein